MKILINPIFRTILILGTWFFCFRKVYLAFTHIPFINIGLPLLILLASVISLLSFLVDYRYYKLSKKPVVFFPAFVSVLCIAGLIGFDQYLKQQDKTPTILYASRFYSGLKVMSIDFRENGTYKCKESGFMGGSYFTRGRYTMEDSMIHLDRSNLYDLIISDRLQMVTLPKDPKKNKRSLFHLLFISSSKKTDTIPETWLFQVDQKGDTIPSAIALRIK